MNLYLGIVAFLSLERFARCQVYFDCPQLPPLTRPAKTVHELRPQDIKVIMTLGDSVTAGFGMMGSHGLNIIEDLQEYRGQSWSIGMDEGAQTVANFLKFYNPSLIGGSLGHHIVELCYDIICPRFQYEPSKDVFNAAQSGAMVPNLVSHEFDYLIKQLESHPDIDMDNDWKLMTIFVGANDVCLGCSGDVPTLTPEDFEINLNKTLEEVRKKIPKLFVNLVLMGNISEIYKLSLKSGDCSNIHRILAIECICAFAPGEEGDKLRQDMDNLASEINKIERKVAAYYAQQNYNDFAVVIQPFVSNAKSDKFPIDFISDFQYIENLREEDNLSIKDKTAEFILLPKCPLFGGSTVALCYSSQHKQITFAMHELLSQLDCFHPSLIAHQNMAKALWNNMITPAAQKRDYFDYTEPFVCPTNTTLLYTN